MKYPPGQGSASATNPGAQQAMESRSPKRDLRARARANQSQDLERLPRGEKQHLAASRLRARSADSRLVERIANERQTATCPATAPAISERQSPPRDSCPIWASSERPSHSTEHAPGPRAASPIASPSSVARRTTSAESLHDGYLARNGHGLQQNRGISIPAPVNCQAFGAAAGGTSTTSQRRWPTGNSADEAREGRAEFTDMPAMDHAADRQAGYQIGSGTGGECLQAMGTQDERFRGHLGPVRRTPNSRSSRRLAQRAVGWPGQAARISPPGNLTGRGCTHRAVHGRESRSIARRACRGTASASLPDQRPPGEEERLPRNDEVGIVADHGFLLSS